MIHIDLLNNPPPQDWIDRADAVTQQLLEAEDIETRNQIIDDNQALWAELREHLSNISYRKCWYSESINDGAYCHVDHFRPKKKAINEAGGDEGGYWWLAFDWRNYRFSAPANNVPKRDYFHVNANRAQSIIDPIEAEDILFLDPTEIDDPPKLSYDIEGKVNPKSADENSRDYLQAEYTIRRLKLNEKFIEARKDRFRRASYLIQDISRLLILQNQQFDLFRRQTIKNNMQELKQLANPSSEYSAAVKYCLKSSGFEWALEIAIAA
ncbi:hypothetical protein K1F50_18650 [Muricauda oceani]|uniref:TIGR02646 family protein n=1 Tax=Flagellimonas oceani TaxID=2698672 RepID=A0A6G7IZV6_9FLAO|nr:hypothetical protein [Allomuricauda oceani]MBW8244835.1 hypothetical protein [Allomuricauda oceani]QII43854.1 hypothetical protein GVT53_03910 [Allomuricauda oceani]